MGFDLSVLMPVLMPIVAIIVSVGAALFWDGHGGKGPRVERYIQSKVATIANTSCSQKNIERLVRVELEPGDRLKSSDLRARDKREAEAMSA